MAKILIVDDEPRIRELIREHLQYAGYVCEEAGDGSAALSLLSGGGYDLVILDLMMPFMDGMTCLREMRARHINTPVIILTARGEEYDKLAGLEGGADDYVVKPFSPRELVARVRAVLNRTMPRADASSDTMTFGDLTIDTASHTVRVAGEEVALTPKEFDLLVFLASNKGIALSREKILQKVWNYDYFGEDRTVDTHVKMLRGHLGKCRSYIATVWGIGYKFDPDARAIKERRSSCGEQQSPSPWHPRAADVVFVLHLPVSAGAVLVPVHPAAGTAVHQAHREAAGHPGRSIVAELDDAMAEGRPSLLVLRRLTVNTGFFDKLAIDTVFQRCAEQLLCGHFRHHPAHDL